MRRPRPVATYFAILAIALQALWPLLAQARPKSSMLVPVCTVQGVTHYIELPESSTPVEQKAASQHDHCSFCSFGGERFALPSFQEVVLSLKAESSTPRTASYDFQKHEQPALARPRAPPAVD